MALFFQDGGLGSLPVFEGVVAALLTAMSFLAFLGLRYPIQLLPVLIFESLWKLIWLAAVGVPHLLAGDMDAQMSSVLGCAVRSADIDGLLLGAHRSSCPDDFA